VRKFGPEVRLDDPAYIHPTAEIFGKVTIGEGASVWPFAVIRAEGHEIEIGPYTNIQDFVMLHIGIQHGTRIGAYCSIAHHSTIHAATIGDNCLIGVNATVMDGSVIGDNCIVAGGSFLKEGTVIPDNSVVMGTPGTLTRSRNNWVANRLNALVYHRNAVAYARGEHRAWHGPDFDAFIKTEVERLNAEFAALGADIRHAAGGD
jgi:carbonic anhydrase/acetyltransferase-like protein (isoleucine patch superfamily)